MGEVLPFFFTQSSLSIRIIVLKTIYQFFEPSLWFKSWTYIIISITSFFKCLSSSFNFDITTCFDINQEVIFIDRNWLLKHLLDQKISTMLTFLKLKRIITSKPKFAEFGRQFLYFLIKTILESQSIPNSVKDLLCWGILSKFVNK